MQRRADKELQRKYGNTDGRGFTDKQMDEWNFYQHKVEVALKNDFIARGNTPEEAKRLFSRVG